MRILIFSAFAFFLFLSGFSQEIKNDYSQLTRDEILELSYDDLLQLPLEDLMKLADKLGVSVDDLLNMKITVSSKTAMTPRESPGIISIVTGEEIKNSGARDLIDVLNLVPGFQFGYDIDGVIGLGSRGNWGHEGKILILLDGQELNENFYSTFQFGNQIPLDQIKRIEIIRGPGSCIYGGYAELGVINIISKAATDIKGVEVNSSAGLMSKGTLSKKINIESGSKIGDFDYTIGAYYNQAHRSNSFYTYYNTDDSIAYNYDLNKKDGIIDGKNLNVSASYKNLKTRIIYNYYRTHTFEYQNNPTNDFTSILGELKYDWKLNDKLSITPKLNIKEQIPYHIEDPIAPYNRINNRYNGNVTAIFESSKNLVVTGGIEYLMDKAKDKLDDTTSVFENGKKDISYYNIASFLQFFLKTKIVDINIGGRLDKHSKIGENFAPRLALTKVINKFHFKVLYSNAFRAPSIENITANDTIKAEKTNVFEIETGYQLTKSMFFTINFFNIKITNPIVYQYINDEDVYNNFPSTGSYGFELEYRYVRNKGYLTLNYSFFNTSNNKVPYYEILSDKSYMLGMPKHKVSFNSSLKITNSLSISPSAVYYGPRYAYVFHPTEVIELKKLSKKINLNIFVNYENLLVKHLDIGIGCYDVFNKGSEFINPYASDFPPLPGYSREFIFKLSYKFKI